MELATLTTQSQTLRAKLKDLSSRRALIRSQQRKKVGDPDVSEKDIERFLRDRVRHKASYARKKKLNDASAIVSEKEIARFVKDRKYHKTYGARMVKAKRKQRVASCDHTEPSRAPCESGGGSIV